MGDHNNLCQFESIKADMIPMEKSVIANVVELMDPKISTLRSELKSEMCTDIRRLIQEEMALNHYLDRKKESEDSSPSEDEREDTKGEPDKTKINKKSKKTIKL